ncbi:phosphohistidine phosphatase SixA [Tautonia rosea]|uniref:phosphohistidine phosphatase SixA n=1 Tax=Tautonia rosea TaxID=2728037 RepID=UPI001475CA01|nr:phosphohistidine phosphatase SixA [Tautonia rosea]
MRQLFVLRHGIAVAHGTPGYEDDERPLTPKGRTRLKEQLRGLKVLEVIPDRILSSPLPRARETAEIVARGLGIEDRLELVPELRPHASSSSIRRWLDVIPGDSVMIVGHNPAFSELISVLPLGPGTPFIAELKKGGLASFQVDPNGRYTLEWLMTPRVLRRLRT